MPRWLAWIILGFPLVVHAQETDKPKTSVSFTDDFKMRYYADDKRLPDFPDRAVYNYLEQVNRFTAHVSRGPWSGDIQVDEVMFIDNHYYLDDVLYTDPQLLHPDIAWPISETAAQKAPFFRDIYINPEKLRLTYNRRELTVTLGDFYAGFSRGAALSINRNVEMDIDTSIQGMKGVYRPGDWEITALMGKLNRQQVFMFNPNNQLQPDSAHALAALRVEHFGPVTFGGHAVTYDFAEETGWAKGATTIGSGADAFVAGGNLKSTTAGIDWFVETDWYRYPSEILFGGSEPENGFAGYGSAAFYWGATSWLVEAKRYKNAERLNTLVAQEQYEVATPPSLEYERAITEDSAAAVNSNDQWGGKIRTDVMIGQAMPYLSLAIIRDDELGDLHFNKVPETIYHPLIGVEWFEQKWSVILNLGYRIDDRDGSTYGTDQQAHGDIDLKFDIFGPLHIDIASAFESYKWGINEFQQHDYFESENSISLQIGPHFWLIGYTDYSDNPLVNSIGNIGENWY
ncbi:MAG: hypothetical protein HN348_30290, partial [Proteobacteria bacterium]|nr:hypothetical protein [Pseudomonadota bacterium]